MKAYRFVALPRQWPGRPRPDGWKPQRSPFKLHGWARIEAALLAELRRINAKDITVALDVANPGDWRSDGGLRSDAKLGSNRVIVSFTRGDTGVRLTFPCETYFQWQDNLYAIAQTLEKLRAIDRYGVTQGDQQYVGFAALPAGGQPKMTLDDALDLFGEHGEAGAVDLISAPDWLVDAVQKRARAATHPDAGGSTELFQRIEEAARLIDDARRSA